MSLPPDGAVLVRPDGVIAWHSASHVALSDGIRMVLGRRG
ncbi:hypothetical protein [Caballeronia sp. ATUFL_M1_KS5A]